MNFYVSTARHFALLAILLALGCRSQDKDDDEDRGVRIRGSFSANMGDVHSFYSDQRNNISQWPYTLYHIDASYHKRGHYYKFRMDIGESAIYPDFPTDPSTSTRGRCITHRLYSVEYGVSTENRDRGRRGVWVNKSTGTGVWDPEGEGGLGLGYLQLTEGLERDWGDRVWVLRWRYFKREYAVISAYLSIRNGFFINVGLDAFVGYHMSMTDYVDNMWGGYLQVHIGLDFNYVRPQAGFELGQHDKSEYQSVYAKLLLSIPVAG